MTPQVHRTVAQLEAYQIMPADELLRAEPVRLSVSLEAIISRHGMRVVCEECGEDIINERQVRQGARVLCRACAYGAYYVGQDGAAFEWRRAPEIKTPVFINR